MINIDIVGLFVNIDDGLKAFDDRDLFDRERYRNDFAISVQEATTLFVLFQRSGMRHAKAFHSFVRTFLKPLFPTLPSYASFMRRLRDAEKALSILLEASLSPWRGFGMVDASKIPVSHPDRHCPKVFRREATYGHTAFGRFYGFKLHLLCDGDGNIVRWTLSTGSVHDLSPVKNGFLDDIEGLVLADSGYVSREVRFSLMDRNLDFAARPRRNQDEFEKDAWELKYGRVYKTRQRIEGVFNDLKNNLMMVAFRHHHPSMLRIYVMGALLAYQLS